MGKGSRNIRKGLRNAGKFPSVIKVASRGRTLKALGRRRKLRR